MELLSAIFATVPTWLLWSVVVAVPVYWYLTKHYDYWKRAGIPYVKPVPIFGSTVEMFTKVMQDLEMERYRTNGRIYGIYEGRKPVLIVGEPDILRDILVKDFQVFTGRRRADTGVPVTDNMVSILQGEKWKRVRTVITPAFSTGKIKRMISIFSDSAKTLTANFKASAEKKKPVNMRSMFGAFSMDVIASSAFATKIDSHNDPENPFVNAARGTFTAPIPWRMALFFIFPEIMRLLKINIFSHAGVKFFEKVTFKIIEERKSKKQKRNDFLQLLIDAVEREGVKEDDVPESAEIKEMGHEEGNDQIFKSYQSNKTLSNIELVANCVIFFLAGYETTASTLTFIAYELALNPEVQDRLVAEIDRIITEKGELNYEALFEMKYVDNVISEALRKYPIAISVDRLAEEDYEIKHNGIRVSVPKGMIVTVPIYSIHHDPQHYPDPEKFDPDRFTPEQKSKRHPFAYLPFGAGPRNCIGMRFALMEVKVCLAMVLSKFRFTTCSKTQVPIEFLRGQGLLAPKQVLLNVEIRTDVRRS